MTLNSERVKELLSQYVARDEMDQHENLRYLDITGASKFS